jgi:hypothetical protein
MDHPEGAGKTNNGRFDLDRRVRLEFCGTQLSSDSGLLVMRALDDALGLSGLASAALCDNRRGKNIVHRLAHDPVMRQIVGGRVIDAQVALPRRWAASGPRRRSCPRTDKQRPI